MVDPIRRKILKTGAAATVLAAAPRVVAEQAGQGGASASFYEKGEGMPQSDSEALHWYKKAAVQGDAQAQDALAVLKAKAK